MKKFLIALTVVVAAVAIALPASAAELKFGGYYHFKFYSISNISDGDSDGASGFDNDNANWYWTRVRLYFDAIGSEYVKVSTKLEMDNIFGKEGKLAQDTKTVEVKNIFLNFAIPDTPVSFNVGAAGWKVDRAGFINDDMSTINAVAKFDPVLVNVGWARFGDNIGKTEGDWTPFKNGDNVDFFAGSVQYIQEQFLVGFNVGWMLTKSGFFASYPSAKGSTTGTPTRDDDLNLLILSLDFNWNADFWSVYATGLMNAGKDEGFIQGPVAAPTEDEIKYGGYLIAAGGQAQFDEWGVGLDFVLISGDDDSTDDKADAPIVVNPGSSLPSYKMDAIVMPGLFDDENSTTQTAKATAPSPANRLNNTDGISFGSGNSIPGNIWGIGAHGTFAPMEKSLLKFGVAYFQFLEDVYENPTLTSDGKDLGFSAYVRYTQAIVDNLSFKTEFGYLFAGDAYSAVKKSTDDAYKIGAGLFWSW
jgi:hypothetical protein